MRSPPLTPLRTHTSPSEAPTSPTPSHKTHIRRRTSSFSSNHDRSPITPRSSHRFSNASAYSAELTTPIEGGAGGLGNLADELDQLDDEGEEIEDESGLGDAQKEDVIRDSGIDVSYLDKSEQEQQLERLQSNGKPPDQHTEDALSPELEDAMNDIARLVKQSDLAADPLIPRFTKNLQNLGNQTSIESGLQRVNVSTNSMSAYLTKETKAVQQLSTASLSPFGGFSTFVDEQAAEESMPFIDALIEALPMPDAQAAQELSKLSHETEMVASVLFSLQDTLQMGKQSTNTAARHLRNTQETVAKLIREQETADLARLELGKSDVEQKIQSKWAAQQCRDIVAGFDSFCDDLKSTFVQSVKANA